jgi:DNA-binding MarR family transcriptional regulator
MMHIHHEHTIMSTTDPAVPAEFLCACANLRRAARALSRVYEDALAAVDLSSTQMTVLMFLGHRGPTPLSELAGILAMDRTSLYRALRPLERRGLVRVRATAERRAKEVLLTRDGEQHLESARPHWRRAQDAFVRAFGPTAWDGLRHDLTRVVAVARDL